MPEILFGLPKDPNAVAEVHFEAAMCLRQRRRRIRRALRAVGSYFGMTRPRISMARLLT